MVYDAVCLRLDIGMKLDISDDKLAYLTGLRPYTIIISPKTSNNLASSVPYLILSRFSLPTLDVLCRDHRNRFALSESERYSA